MRTVSALALAGIFVAIVASRTRGYDGEDRSRIIRWGAYFLLPLALMPIFAAWYFGTVPPSARDLALGGAVAMTFIFVFGVLLSFLVAVYAFFGMLRRSRDVNLETALLMAAIAFLATGSMEFVREGIRKPYVLYGIMYSNGILLADTTYLNEKGVLANAAWIKPDTLHYAGSVAAGEAVYRVECLRCHEVVGYNGMLPLVKGWNRDLIFSALDQLERLKGFMPPFIGTADEKSALADYLFTLTGTSIERDTTREGAPPDTGVGLPAARDIGRLEP